jgi:tetratricopeptide (TPR) repeat protein
MVMFETEQRTGIYDVARSYSLLARDSNLDEAARWFDLAICEIIRSADYRPGSYITLPLYVRRWSVEAALKRNDSAAIRRHIDRIMDLDPLDIDLAERILPELREAGLDEVADEALDRILAIGQSYMERFPDDAMTANNLAWVSAMNGRYLDEALQLSRRAVYCQPESAIYRDTLAEVLFRLNRKREALQIEEACLIDDPSQWHLHQQVEKYREASES